MPLKAVAISGALDRNSANSGLIRAMLEAQNPNIHIEVADISPFPLFNADIVMQNGFPAEIQSLRDKISNSHALILLTPEHNHKVSAALKNAYDWLSFAPDQSVSPPIKYMVAGIGSACYTGGEKALTNLKRIFHYCKVKPMPHELQIKKTEQNFDQYGNVTNSEIRQQISVFLQDLVNFIKQNKTL